MNRITLILPVCALLVIIYLIMRLKTLANDLMDDMKTMTHPIKVMINIAAILLVIAGGAALGYAAFWLTVSVVYRALTS